MGCQLSQQAADACGSVEAADEAIEKPEMAPAGGLKEYFSMLFDQIVLDPEGALSQEDVLSLARALCRILLLPPPEPHEILVAVWHSLGAAGGRGLSRGAFATCAAAWVRRASQAELPAVADVLQVRRQILREEETLLLSSPPSTGSSALGELGVRALCVRVSQVRGLLGGAGRLAPDEELCCRVTVTRSGRLLPRCAARSAGLRSGRPGPGGEPVWGCGEELRFDDAALFQRPGVVSVCIAVRPMGRLACDIASAALERVPTTGVVELPLVDPVACRRIGEAGRPLGTVRVRIGWCGDPPLLQRVYSRLAEQLANDGPGAVREELRCLGGDAVALLAGKGDGMGRTLLMAASHHKGGAPLIRDLLVLRTPAWRQRDAYSASALHHAALFGSVDSLAALLGCRAAPRDVDAPADGLDGATPLMLALLGARTEHALLLIGHGARLDRSDAHGVPAAAWLLHGSRSQSILDRFRVGRGVAIATADSADRCDEQLESLLSLHEQRGSLLSLLVAEAWRTAPPWDLETLAPREAFGRMWFAWAAAVVEQGPPGALKRFSAELLAACRAERPGSQAEGAHLVLLNALFAEALVHRHEDLAGRLVTELGALRPPPPELRLAAAKPILSAAERMNVTRATGSDAAPAPSAPPATPLGAGPPAAPPLAEAQKDAVEAAPGSDASRSPGVGTSPSAGSCDSAGEGCGCPPGGPDPACVALDLAIAGRVARVALELLAGRGRGRRRSGPARLGSWARAMRLLRLAEEQGVPALVEEVSRRLPGELLVDDWDDPVVPASDDAAMACPVCLESLSLSAAALRFVVGGSDAGGRTPACPHVVCQKCSEQLDGKCPLCRTRFTGLQRLPDPCANPAAWFRFATCSAGRPRSREASLSAEDVARLLPVSLKLCPESLDAAMCPGVSGGLWSSWAQGADGRISKEAFYDPARGLLRWILAHRLTEQASWGFAQAPSVAEGGMEWLRQFVTRRPSREDPGRRGGVRRGSALCALLRLVGATSLDLPTVERCRKWVEAQWPAGVERIEEEAFFEEGGLAGALLEQAARHHTGGALAALGVGHGVERIGGGACEAARAADVGTVTKALALLSRFAVSPCGAAWPEGAGGDVTIGATTFLPAAVVLSCARRRGQRGEARRLVLGRGVLAACEALRRHPGQHLVVGWACRLAVVAALGDCAALDALGEAATWPDVVEAVRGAATEERPFRVDSPAAAEIAQLAIRAIVELSAAPRGAGDDAFLGSVAAVALLVWIADAAAESEGVPRLLWEALRAARPAFRAFAAAMAALLACDAVPLAQLLASQGFELTPYWAPPTVLPPSDVCIGQMVEVCLERTWHRAVVRRAPLEGPETSRDECWVVQCGSGDKTGYFRHLWPLGWRSQAARGTRRLVLAAFAMAARLPGEAPRVPRGLGGSSELLRQLLEAVLLHGLAAKALAPAPTPQGPLLRGPQQANIRTGDVVWLEIPVYRARELQSRRHGGWFSEMAFCLDSPGRVVDTLSVPDRARISHGSLGTFTWNPAAVTRVLPQSAEPLPFEDQHGPLVVDDEVLLTASQERIVALQVGHGGWSPRMARCLGRYGRVRSIDHKGDVRIDMPGSGGSFLWNPAAIEPQGGGCVVTLCAQAVMSMDDEGAAIWLLLCLTQSAGEAAVRQVVAAVERAGGRPPMRPRGQTAAKVIVPAGLRAFGALAILAAAMDLRRVLAPAGASGVELRELSRRLESGGLPEAARLPAVMPPPLLELLRSTPAMTWPAKDLGGISFRDVVRGDADVFAGAERWMLAFFASRHRRLLSPFVAARPSHNC